MIDQDLTLLTRQAWRVGALCLAITDNLQARFNPVTVRGEISGFSRASSGHCYFTLKDDQGQLRCAMFKRTASLQSFHPRDGQQVEVVGKLGVYEARGDLQLVVDVLRPLGQGSMLEVFMQLKAKLESLGLFDQNRKRPLPQYPRGIGVVTSGNSAAWHDVMTAVRRRTPHIPVVLAPTRVQGAEAPSQIVMALHSLYELVDEKKCVLDVILLVRGGGSLEDLWAFNDEQLAFAIAQSPVPVVCGVGHETDFSIADFVADVRAPTPTAAVEMCAASALQTASELAYRAQCLQSVIQSGLARREQLLDYAVQRLVKPKDQLMVVQERLNQRARRLWQSVRNQMQAIQHDIAQLHAKLELLHPQQVLNRGFAWVSDENGQVVMDAVKLKEKQELKIHLAKGARKVVVQ